MHPLIPWFETPRFPPNSDVAIHGFGLMVAIGFWLGSIVAQKKAAKDGLDPQIINRFVTWLVAGTFIGGHLGHALFYEPQYYMKHPVELLYVWDGLSSTGGLLTCIALTIWFFKKAVKQPFWPYADSLITGFMTGWFFGRMGCFIAHDHPGIETQFWLGVYGICPSGDKTVACHDLGLYEALWSGLMAGIYYLLDKKPRFPGFFVGVAGVSYGILRFIMDIFRHPDTDTRYFGWTPAMFFSVAALIAGAAILWTRRAEAPVRNAA